MSRENPNTPRLRERVARILAKGKSALLLHRNSRGPYGPRADTTHVQRVGENRYRSARRYRGRWSRSQDSADSLDKLLAKIFDGSCSAPAAPQRVLADTGVLKGSVCWVPGMAEPPRTQVESREWAAEVDAHNRAFEGRREGPSPSVVARGRSPASCWAGANEEPRPNHSKLVGMGIIGVRRG